MPTELDLYLSTFTEPQRTDLRDEYEETAATLEFEQGNSRARAERLAMEQLIERTDHAER